MKQRSGFKCFALVILAVTALSGSVSAQTDFWTKTTLPSNDVLSIAAGNGGYVYVRTPDIYRSSDGGVTWESAGGVSIAGGRNPICVSPKCFVVAGGSGQVAISSDEGQTWATANTIYDYSGNQLPVLSLIYNDSTGTVWAGTSGDGIHLIDGFDWYVSSTAYGQAQGYNGGSASYVWSLYQDPSTGYVFASFLSGGVTRSLDNGQTWKYVNFGNGNFTVSAWASTVNGYVFAGTGSGVFRSTDSGATFVPADTSGFDFAISALAAGSNENIYAATDAYGSSSQPITAKAGMKLTAG